MSNFKSKCGGDPGGILGLGCRGSCYQWRPSHESGAHLSGHAMMTHEHLKLLPTLQPAAQRSGGEAAAVKISGA